MFLALPQITNHYPLLENRETTKRLQREHRTQEAADRSSCCRIPLPSQDLLPFEGDDG